MHAVEQGLSEKLEALMPKLDKNDEGVDDCDAEAERFGVHRRAQSETPFERGDEGERIVALNASVSSNVVRHPNGHLRRSAGRVGDDSSYPLVEVLPNNQN